VKESLVTPYAKHSPGIAPDGTSIEVPYYTVNYDFRLRRA
jgi:hydroxyquinol 1,2-dioxygenase